MCAVRVAKKNLANMAKKRDKKRRPSSKDPEAAATNSCAASEALLLNSNTALPQHVEAPPQPEVNPPGQMSLRNLLFPVTATTTTPGDTSKGQYKYTEHYSLSVY